MSTEPNRSFVKTFLYWWAILLTVFGSVIAFLIGATWVGKTHGVAIVDAIVTVAQSIGWVGWSIILAVVVTGYCAWHIAYERCYTRQLSRTDDYTM